MSHIRRKAMPSRLAARILCAALLNAPGCLALDVSHRSAGRVKTRPPFANMPADPVSLVVVAAATANEPPPVLSADVLQLLQTAGRSSSPAAYVVSPGTGTGDRFPLTPQLGMRDLIATDIERGSHRHRRLPATLRQVPKLVFIADGLLLLYFFVGVTDVDGSNPLPAALVLAVMITGISFAIPLRGLGVVTIMSMGLAVGAMVILAALASIEMLNGDVRQDSLHWLRRGAGDDGALSLAFVATRHDGSGVSRVPWCHRLAGWRRLHRATPPDLVARRPGSPSQVAADHTDRLVGGDLRGQQRGRLLRPALV